MKRKTRPYATLIHRHQPVNQVILDQPFDSIDPRAFPNLPHKNCNGDEGCITWPTRIKRCGVYCGCLLPGQPRRYPIKWIEVRPHNGGQQTLVLFRAAHNALGNVITILRLAGVTGAVVSPVKHTQIEMYGNIHPDDVPCFVDGVRELLGSRWGLYHLWETTPGTIHKVKAAHTFLEGELVLNEIGRVLKGKSVIVELVVYRIWNGRKWGRWVKVEVVMRALEGQAFTGTERAKLEKITAGFLTVLFMLLGVETHGLSGRQHGQAYPFKRVPGSHYGARIDEARWFAVELGQREGLSQPDAIEKYLDTGLSLLASKPVIRSNKSRHGKRHGTPAWGGPNGDTIRTPITDDMAALGLWGW